MAFGESWVIGIMLRFSGGQAMRGFAQLSAAAKTAEMNLTKAQLALKKFDETTVAAGTRIAGSFALIGAAIAGYGIYNAGKFQQAMIGAGATLHATKGELESLSNMVMDVSGKTAQGNVTTAQQFTTALTAGLDTMGRTHSERIANATKLFWPLAQFADSLQFMQRSKGGNMTAQEGVNYGIQFAHMFQAYDVKSIRNMLNWIMALTTVTAESPMRALTQSKYFVGLGTSVGLKPEQIFPLLGIMGQMGFLRARGGMATGRMLLAAIAGGPEGHMTKLQGPALAALGLYAGGHSTVLRGDQSLDWSKFRMILQEDRSKYGPAGFANLIQRGFGITAGQFMSVFMSPAAQSQYDRVVAQMKSYEKDGGAVAYLFKLFIGDGTVQGSFLGSLQRFATNAQNVLTHIFLPLLPGLTVFFNGMSDKLGAFAHWLGLHKDIAGMLGTLVLAFTGLAGARFAIGMLIMAIRSLAGAQTLAAATGLSKAAISLRAIDNVLTGGLLTSFSSLTGSFTAIAAVAGLVAGIFSNIKWAAQSLSNSKLAGWLIGGGYDHGVPMPGARMNVDPAGHFIPQRGATSGYGPINIHNTIHTHGTTPEQAKKIVSMAMDGIKSAMQSRGDTSWTNAQTAGALGMEGAPITHGFG